MKSVFKSFVILFCVALYDAKKLQFRCDYKYFKEADGWLKLHEVPTNWHDARLRCYLEGAVLASPLTSGIGTAMMTLKGDVINTTIPDQKTPISIYTGIHATYSLKDYTSIEGNPLSEIRHKWSKGSPYSDLVGDADCLVMGPDGGLHGVDGEEAEYPYVCYKKYEKMRVNHCGTVDDDYILDEKTGSCYKFHHVARPWRHAYMTCAVEGGYLAVINSDQEADVIKAMLHNYKIEPREKDSKPRGRKHHDEAFSYEPEGDDSGEEGSVENVVHVGFTRAEMSKWLPMTIHGQTLNEAGYGRVGQKHQDKRGLCGAMDDRAFLINVSCNKMWYRFVCERDPRSICDNDE